MSQEPEPLAASAEAAVPSSEVAGPETAAEEAEVPAKAVIKHTERNPFSEWAITILLLLFGITFLVQAFVIPTPSMEDTLLIGDHLLVDKLAFAPTGRLGSLLLPYSDVQRGDIIVFRYPEDTTQTFVKRVIGVPGDHIRFDEQQLYLNGRPVKEPYVYHKNAMIDPYRDHFPSVPNISLGESARRMLRENVENGELIVPDGFYFALGDNRDNSSDSRYWGFVPRRNIIGKPLLIYWSFDAPTERWTNGSLLNFQDLRYLVTGFVEKTRWERTFGLVRGESVE
jgi:signal peptidase I